jgi:hypothetical protein
VRGHSTKWARKNKVESGVGTIFAPDGADIDDHTGELIIPSGSNIKVNSFTVPRCLHGGLPTGVSWANNKKFKFVFFRSVVEAASTKIIIANCIVLIPWGTETSLPLRERFWFFVPFASDKATNATEAELSNKVFGGNGDVLNLKSQFNRCSNGQVQFEPLTSNTIVGPDGVYTVNLPSTIVTDASDVVIRTLQLTRPHVTWLQG